MAPWTRRVRLGKAEKILPLKRAIIEKAYGMKTDFDMKKILKEYVSYGKKLHKYIAVRLNGVASLAITKLDVLTGIDELKVCIGYRYHGNILREFPSEISDLPDCVPVYNTLSDWQEDIGSVTSLSERKEKH